MATEVGIANTALRRLGADTITSFTQGTKSANSVNDLYTETLEDLLAEHDWNFAPSRVKLAAFGYDNAFGMPADWMRTVGVYNNDAGLGTVRHSEEIQDDKNVILASVEDIYIDYVFNQTDPNRMSGTFRIGLSRRLAAAMAIDLTNSNRVRLECEEEATKLVMKSKSADAKGGTPVRRPRGTWADTRHQTRVGR